MEQSLHKEIPFEIQCQKNPITDLNTLLGRNQYVGKKNISWNYFIHVYTFATDYKFEYFLVEHTYKFWYRYKNFLW